MTFRRADVLLETFVCLIPVVGDHNGIAALENIVAAIFAFVGHGTTKKERLQDPAGRKAEKIWRHVQQEVLSKKSAIKAAACFPTVL